MKEYDLIVIGSGAGMNIVSNALQYDLSVAVIEHGPLGGTCLNNGCIPTKIMVHPADVVRTLDEARKIGITSSISDIDFSLIMERMRSFVGEGHGEMEVGVKATEQASDKFRWYRETGEFMGDHTIRVGNETITAPRIVIAAGSRPLIPKIEGLDDVGYLDNISVLDLQKPPESLIILGGGYIACEFGHFFSAMGTKVTIVGRNALLLKNEEPEISAIVKRRFSEFAKIHTGFEAYKVERDPETGQKIVYARSAKSGKSYRVRADEIMLAAGRRSNADLFRPELTGVETDARGWVTVDKYLRTTAPNIWALGDATGEHLFRHTANYEADVVWQNAFMSETEDGMTEIDYHAVPHAVFGFPQVAGVGLTEAQAKAAGLDYLVGAAKYTDVTKGYAMGEDDSLVKVITEAESMRILGCHVVGSEAAILVQQIVYMMNTESGDYIPMARSQIIHPALSEVMANAFGSLRPPAGAHHGHAHHHGDSHSGSA